VSNIIKKSRDFALLRIVRKICSSVNNAITLLTNTRRQISGRLVNSKKNLGILGSQINLILSPTLLKSESSMKALGERLNN
jgi:hypothetical protein